MLKYWNVSVTQSLKVRCLSVILWATCFHNVIHYLKVACTVLTALWLVVPWYLKQPSVVLKTSLIPAVHALILSACLISEIVHPVHLQWAPSWRFWWYLSVCYIWLRPSNLSEWWTAVSVYYWCTCIYL